MSFVFNPNQSLNQNDLFVLVRDSSNMLVDPSEIYFTLYRVTEIAPIKVMDRTAATRYQLGWWYVNTTILDDWASGTYIASFEFKLTPSDPDFTRVVTTFYIWDYQVKESEFDRRVFSLVNKLRNLLRDNNPDRNYHFRPPTHAEPISAYTKRVGYIWEDFELAEYLDMSINMLNMAPPATGFTPDNLPKEWETLLLYGAAINALVAISLNWIEEEFGYSIGGVTLDIQKAAKYQSMIATLEGQFDKQLDRAKQTIKIVKGVRQSMYGVSLQGYLGPFMSRGVISVRSFTDTLHNASFW